MKKIIYKTLLISLFIILAFTIKSYGASDFSYTLDANGNATITAYNGSESNLTIPSTIEGHNVVTIGKHAFDESRNSTNGHTIKNLVISEGIQRIELLAFVKCTNLETVKLPESLTFLDAQTFLQCGKLNSINIPSKIKSIGDCTFQETDFTEFDIPENVKSIDSRALGICSKLEKVRVYSTDISYASRVFEYDSSNLVLYGYEGSTTQTYAQQNGIKFEILSNSEEPPVTTMGDIHLNKNELSLKENESETLTVNFIEMSSSTKVIWSSSDEKVATVENGKVTAKNIGNTIITVSTEDGQYKDTCTVSVVKKDSSTQPTVVPMTSISLNKSSLSLYVGNTETLIATILPNNVTDKSLVWSSSNSSIATVENGKIIAKKVGTTIITVSNADGTKKATCNVTVINKDTTSGTTSDNTVVGGKLPQTGVNMKLTIISILIMTLITVIIYKKYNNYKDIK